MVFDEDPLQLPGSVIPPTFVVPLTPTKYAVAPGTTPNALAREYLQISLEIVVSDGPTACWSARAPASAAASAEFWAVRRWR